MCKKYIVWTWGIIVIIIFYANALSQIPVQVTFETEEVSDFVWSPDGSQFAYIALENDSTRLYRIDMDGRNKTMLSNLAFDPIDWKGSVIVFRSKDPLTSGSYSVLLKKINPDGSGESTIIGPYWYSEVYLRADANWILYDDAPNGWWRTNRCDLNGNNALVVSHNNLVHRIGWFGNNYILYGRGPNYNTPCGIHKVNFDGGEHIQLTPENLPTNTLFSGSPDTSKILYCDGSTSIWDIWIMDPDGSNKTQLTTDPAHDFLSGTRENIWSLNSQAFYFVSERSGKGDIYKMNIDGSNLIPFTTHDSVDFSPLLSPDGKKMAFISKRDGVNNIWMLNVSDPYIANIWDVPNDQGGYVTIKWRASSLDSDLGSIPFYSIWRLIPEGLSNHKAGSQKEITKDFSGTAYMFKTINGKEYAWEWIANQPAHGFSFYTYTAATLYDSMSATDGEHYFMVSAHPNEPNVYYDSNIESGCSIDNLPPIPPTGLAATVAENSIELSWDESTEADLRFYVIYRNGLNYASTSQTFYKDTDVTVGESYSYKLIAVDVHENSSAFSAEVTVTISGFAAQELNLPKAFQLSQNYPNPFNPETIIKYQLPATSTIELIIYNASGQPIRTLSAGTENAGYYQKKWDGKNNEGIKVPSGLYFYRLQTAKFIQTRKMLLIK